METLDEETLTLMRKEIRDGRVIQAVKVARERTTLDLHQLMQLADFLSDEERRNPSSYGEE